MKWKIFTWLLSTMQSIAIAIYLLFFVEISAIGIVYALATIILGICTLRAFLLKPKQYLETMHGMVSNITENNPTHSFDDDNNWPDSHHEVDAIVLNRPKANRKRKKAVRKQVLIKL